MDGAGQVFGPGLGLGWGFLGIAGKGFGRGCLGGTVKKLGPGRGYVFGAGHGLRVG